MSGKRAKQLNLRGRSYRISVPQHLRKYVLVKHKNARLGRGFHVLAVNAQ